MEAKNNPADKQFYIAQYNIWMQLAIHAKNEADYRIAFTFTSHYFFKLDSQMLCFLTSQIGK